MREITPGDGSWIQYFLKIAQLVATRSKDNSTQVGCVIVDTRKTQIATGYNGLVMGLPQEKMTREEKLLRTLHAEENAILFSDRARLRNATLYCTSPLCSRCMRMSLQVGITTIIVVSASDEFAGRWKDDCEQAEIMAAKKGIDYFHVTEESLI